MKVEIKNWVGVVVLLCLGFILGRITNLPDVKANPQDSEIGRYQLVAGERVFTYYAKGEGNTTSTPAMFRIDTERGMVERWFSDAGEFKGKDGKVILWGKSGWTELIPMEFGEIPKEAK